MLARIADNATYDEPASASVGIAAVYVNASLAYAEGEGGVVLAMKGQLLPRAGAPAT